jgi:sugar lactone lactonase YvrE
MKDLQLIPVSLMVLMGFSSAFARAEKLWETDEVYKGPESVAYDSERGFLYVSNYTEGVKTGGFYGQHCISKANLNGEIIKFDWIGGLTTPTGICISNNKLYIVERFGVVVYDLEADKVAGKIYIKTTNFLNDITVDPAGNIYVSESDTNVLYRISDGKVEKWMDSEAVSRPNGVLYDNGNLIVGVNSDNYLKAVDVSTKKVSNIAELGPGIIDGIKKCGDGYLVSHYLGNLYFIQSSGRVRELINTRNEEINIADFEYIPDRNLVVIPALKDNKLLGFSIPIFP